MELKVQMKKKLDEKFATNNGMKSAKQEHKWSGCHKFGCKKMHRETHNAQGQDFWKVTMSVLVMTQMRNSRDYMLPRKGQHMKHYMPFQILLMQFCTMG